MQNSKGRKEKNENDFPEKGIALEKKNRLKLDSNTRVGGHCFESHLYTMSHLMGDPERLARCNDQCRIALVDQGKLKKKKKRTKSRIRQGVCPCSYKVDRSCCIAESEETGAGSDCAYECIIFKHFSHGWQSGCVTPKGIRPLRKGSCKRVQRSCCCC